MRRNRGVILKSAMIQTFPRLRAIVTVCGGGGLAMGIMRGLERNFPDPETRPIVFVAETEGADCFHQSCTQKKPVVLPAITSIAKSLGSLRCDRLYREFMTDSLPESMPNQSESAPQPSRQKTSQTQVYSYRISDKQAVEAVSGFLDRSGHLVEPACGAALSFVTHGMPERVVDARTGEEVPNPLWEEVRHMEDSSDSTQHVVVEVCGGKMVNEQMLEEWKRNFDC